MTRFYHELKMDLVVKMTEQVKKDHPLVELDYMDAMLVTSCANAARTFYEAKEDWVSIKEQKPNVPNHTKCYYCDKGGNVHEGWCARLSNGMWNFYNDDIMYHEGEITHYIIKKLPQPPKE